MPEFTAKPYSFARLNSVLGTSTPPIPYCWSGAEVFLDQGRNFDERAYLDSKMETLLKRHTVLTEDQIKAVFARVIDHNLNVLFDLNNCPNDDLFHQYDAKFNLLLEAAFSHSENEHSLRISKENIKNALQVSDGWMNVNAVNNLVRLTSTNPKEAPDPNKFVPKHRR